MYTEFVNVLFKAGEGWGNTFHYDNFDTASLTLMAKKMAAMVQTQAWQPPKKKQRKLRMTDRSR